MPTLEDLIDDEIIQHINDTDAVFHAWVLTQLAKDNA